MPQIPSNAQDDHVILEMASPEQDRSGLLHRWAQYQTKVPLLRQIPATSVRVADHPCEALAHATSAHRAFLVKLIPAPVASIDRQWIRGAINCQTNGPLNWAALRRKGPPHPSNEHVTRP